MMQLATVLPPENAQLAELHHRAQRDALARAARGPPRLPPAWGCTRPGIPAIVTAWARRLRPEPGLAGWPTSIATTTPRRLDSGSEAPPRGRAARSVT
jgi:hypothetical protein